LFRNSSGPSVVAIKDSGGSIFGCFGTDTWHPQSKHYGNGQCFLWKLDCESNEVIIYKSTGENEYFQFSEPHFISMGCSDGNFGLYIDEQLLKGSSSKVTTFDNEILTTQKDFEIEGLEMWTFTNQK
ncbi:TLD-domain-containing protein, partial [Rozella allomycis CSF55]